MCFVMMSMNNEQKYKPFNDFFYTAANPKAHLIVEGSHGSNLDLVGHPTHVTYMNCRKWPF